MGTKENNDDRLPERPMEPSAPRFHECEEYGEPLCGGVKYIVWNGERLCMECAAEAVADALDTDAFRRHVDAFAEIFGFEMEAAYGA